jgi:alkylation response protein AidB-like acyl-CoA dehydrogenase
MFLVKIHQPGITIRRIKQVNGNDEFCQEFFDDVELPLSSVVGEVNGGWAVASRQTTHERSAVGGASIYVTIPRGSSLEAEVEAEAGRGSSSATRIIDLARRSHRDKESRVRELIAETHIIDTVSTHLTDRIVAGMRSESLPVTAGAIIRMYTGDAATRRAEIALEVAGTAAVHDGTGGDLDLGRQFLFRQALSIGGGTVEVSKNVVSERVLNMPREFAADRDVPFNQVRQSASG